MLSPCEGAETGKKMKHDEPMIGLKQFCGSVAMITPDYMDPLKLIGSLHTFTSTQPNPTAHFVGSIDANMTAFIHSHHIR